MSDADNDNEMKGFATEEEEDDEESFSRLPKGKTGRVNRRNLSELRHPRQRYCAKWEIDFPWLRADKIDESTGFCKICDKRLVCKKSHLERHQGSFKHLRLSGFGVSELKTETETTEFLECGKLEPGDDEEYEQNAIEVDPDYSVEFEVNPKAKKAAAAAAQKAKKPKLTPVKTPLRKAMTGSSPSSSSAMKSSTPKPTSLTGSQKLDRFKLLKRIDRDRHELNAFYSRRQQLSPVALVQPPRDSFDLFFDSVSASVKTLPPKLAAEVKSRVSQIIAEFELRAICEREALESSAAAVESNVVVASTTHEMVASTSATSLDPSAVPHIVYTFQPKLRE